MKKIFTLMAAAAIALTANAQSLRGDVNKDNNVDISDVNAVISIICGSDTVKYEEAKYITPYYTNNEDILGTWTSTTGTVTFNEDGTTDSQLGAKYQYRPLQGRILYFDAKDKLTAVQSLMDKTDEYIILCDNNSNTFTYYYKNGLPPVMVESITLSETSLTLGIDDTKTLTATVLPENADNKEVTWASSNPDVVYVSQIGKVIPANYGTATITATAKDGSGVVGSCEVTVTSFNGKTQTVTANGVTFNMIPVEGGTFTMGATSEQSNGYSPNSYEKPTHSVTLSNYYVGETEVTQALWYAVMGAKPSSSYSWETTYGLGDDYPAYYISYTECQEFITKLNALTGKTFRMLTEAEWEYAARGGNKSKGYIFSGGNTIGDVAWYTVNSYDKGSISPDYGIHPVATKSPNELGIYDMSGNVWEWCSDWYGSYTSDAQTNPTGATSGSCRVGRGGSWGGIATCCRVSYRRSYIPSSRNDYLGLRLAISQY